VSLCLSQILSAAGTLTFTPDVRSRYSPEVNGQAPEIHRGIGNQERVLPGNQNRHLNAGKLFRRLNKNWSAWGDGLTEEAVWHVVREHARKASIERLAPHHLRRYAESFCSAHAPGGPLFSTCGVVRDSA
jgi:hypothetical protein